MRKLREVLRLKHERGLSHRAIAQACAIGLGTVTLYLRRTAQSGLGWPLPADLDDAGLEARLFRRPAPAPNRARPDCAHTSLPLSWFRSDCRFESAASRSGDAAPLPGSDATSVSRVVRDASSPHARGATCSRALRAAVRMAHPRACGVGSGADWVHPRVRAVRICWRLSRRGWVKSTASSVAG